MILRCDLCGKEYEIGHKPMNKPWIDIVYTPYNSCDNMTECKRFLFLCDECYADILSRIEAHKQA